MMTFDPTKPVRTRGGRPARIICYDRGGLYPIVALVTYPDNEWPEVKTYTKNGQFDSRNFNSSMDLINVPEKHVRWLNLYPISSATSGCYHTTRELADKYAARDRIARVRIEFEEGKFDE
jgi:hypothetical protein